MHYPDFFNQVSAIKLRDPLSDLLGTFEQGELEISYLDVVKGAGHSCPTVAGAYLLSYHALRVLYPQGFAIRGDISVDIAQNLEDGSTGVISNVISYITGATDKSGFKGLKGSFIRHSLMHFNQDIPAIRFTRLDTQTSIDLFYDPRSIAVDPKQMQIMKKILAGNASINEKKLFGSLWQERVKKILIDNFENDKILKIKKV